MANDKTRSIAFFPSDWRADSDLAFCSLAARGLWIEMLCIMHGCTPYGHLTKNGQPMSVKDLSLLVKSDPEEVSVLLKQLAEANVFSTTNNGIIFSRRMVRTNKLHNIRSKAGSRGAQVSIQHRFCQGKKGEERKGMDSSSSEEEKEDSKGEKEEDSSPMPEEHWKELEAKPKGKPKRVPFSLEDALSMSPHKGEDWARAVQTWLNYRQSRQIPVTRHSWKIAMHELQGCTEEEAIESIRRSIASDYRGLFGPKPKLDKPKDVPPPTRLDLIIEGNSRGRTGTSGPI